jgi:hypothetical protein
VSLQVAFRSHGMPPRAPSTSPAERLLATQGARIIVGATAGAAPAAPVVAAADTLFGPRSAVLATSYGPLVVCDTGHHRVLIWKHVPVVDGAPADLVVGQRDFTTEGRNAQGEISAATFNVPTGGAVEHGILAIADAWNHRVLIWHGLPARSNQSADVVLGQPDFNAALPNRGLDIPRADTLNWCYGVALYKQRLYIADTGNRRILVWDGIPTRNGAPADLVLGQRDFTTRDEGAGEWRGAIGMRWPHAIAAARDALFVADAGMNRVMGWNGLPRGNGARCDFVLGQLDFHAGDHNAGQYNASASTLNMPYGICAHATELVVADTANSRLVSYDMSARANGARARRLAGQRTFSDKGDNRWGFASRDSLCWPYGVTGCGSTVVIADSGNNRVLLWDAS